MNLLTQFNQIFAAKERAMATVITADNDKILASTIGGAQIILKPKDGINAGDVVYYDRISRDIIGVAPKVEFREFGV